MGAWNRERIPGHSLTPGRILVLGRAICATLSSAMNFGRLNPPPGQETPLIASESPLRKSPGAGGSALDTPSPRIPDHELLRKIGGGSYGQVWLARSTLGTYRAAKIVHRRTFEHDRPFEREFAGIQKFEPISRSHEGLVDLLQVGRNEPEGYFYYVMELADDAGSPVAGQVPSEASPGGQPLSCQFQPATYEPYTLKLDLQRRGRLPLEECIQLGIALTDALGYLHGRGLVHRDVKPSNIIFVAGVPKLADVGLVAGLDEARSYVGTEGFIPPEGPGTPQADLYSLGIVLYEMSTGKSHQDFPEPLPDLAAQPDHARWLEFNTVVHKACRAEPHERYQAAEKMQADLTLLQRGESVRRLRALEHRVSVLTKIGLAAAGLLVIAAVAYLLAVSQARRAQKARSAAEQLLYAADMSVAQQALEAGSLVRATALLEAHRPGGKSDIQNPKSETDRRGFEWYYLWNLCRGDETHTFRGHQAKVQSVAISPDGKLLASAGNDQTIRLWDLSEKTNLVTLRGHSGPVNSVAFSPDGTMLASGSADKTVKLWDVASWKVMAELTNHAYAVIAVVFTPDSKRLAASTEGASLKLWDIKTSQELHDFRVEADFTSLAISPDGHFLAISTSDSRVHFWDLSTFQPSSELYEEAGASWSMAFSPDSRMLATARSDGVFLWDLAQRSVAARLKGHEGEVHSVKFSPDGKTLASASGDNTIRLWDLASRQPLRILKGHQDRVWTLAFAPDGQTLVSGSWDHDVKLWALSPKEEPGVLRGHTDAVLRVAFSPDDRILVSASLDGTVRFWDVNHATNTAMFNGHTGGVTGVVFSRDGTTLASCGLDNAVRFWNAATREQQAVFPGERPWSCLALSPDGRTLAVGGGWWTEGGQTLPSKVSFWDLLSRQRLTNPVNVHEMVQTLSFSPDGRTLAVGMADDSVELVDVASRRSLFLSTNLFSLAAWSPEDGMLAVSDEKDRIGLLDIGPRRIWRWLQMPSAATRYAACSPDGKTMAIFYTTTRIKLCNVATGRDVATLQGHQGFGMYLAFSHDGQTLASAGNDRTVRLWRAPRSEASAQTR